MQTLVCLFALGLSVFVAAPVHAEILIPDRATWLYLDDGSDQGTDWQTQSFDDAGWSAGRAELGYGDDNEHTEVDSGPAGNHHITTYFRHHFAIGDPLAISGLRLRIQRDDGAVVHLNGTELYRTNMPGGAIGYQTVASTTVGGGAESTFFEAAFGAGLLEAGDNVLAVEIHQRSGGSSDISFDVELSTTPPAEAPDVLRGPYLQMGTSSTMVVRWRTDIASESHVRYGPTPGDLSSSENVPGPTTEHEVTISGLSPATRYYYSVGTSAFTLAGADPYHYFTTSPVPGTRQPLRIWVIGDSGEANHDARLVRNAYLNYADPDASPPAFADAWLMLGDNAYNTGTDAEYTAAVFDTYPQVLRNTVLWPSPGNHEFGASDSPSQTGPYYDAFTMPRFGEAGGITSGTEAYYSFDHGNVHFVAIDSHDTPRTVGSDMYDWLDIDLAATNQDFVIVYWHHPPYTFGSHNSDNEAHLVEMREVLVPLIESHGVDLQLTGHSHSYERTKLIDGHYGDSASFNSTHEVDAGDGDPAGDGSYTKTAIGKLPNAGAVYSVVGSSSKNSGGLSQHPAMAVWINFEGSMVIDVVGRQLDAYWIDADGVVDDHFRLVKGPALPLCNDALDNDADGASDYPDDPGCLNANSEIEDPACDDGIDNDTDGLVDWDGGGLGSPDPQCVGKPWKQREQPNASCGLGAELVLLLPWLQLWLRRRVATP